MMVVKMEEGFDRIAAAAYAWSHTAAPMLSGTLVTVIGFMPVGFARSTAGEYAGNIFWIVGFALIASWFVAVVFTPYLGVKLLPDIKPVAGGHAAIYATPQLPAAAPRWSAGRSAASSWSPAPWSPSSSLAGRRHGRGQAAVLPDLRPARSAGRGADAGRHQHRRDERRDRKGRGLAAAAARSARSSPAISARARRASSWPTTRNCPIPSFAKIVVLTPDAESARRAEASAARARSPKGWRRKRRLRATQLVFGPLFAVPGRVPGHGARSRDRCDRSPTRSRR